MVPREAEKGGGGSNARCHHTKLPTLPLVIRGRPGSGTQRVSFQVLGGDESR